MFLLLLPIIIIIYLNISLNYLSHSVSEICFILKVYKNTYYYFYNLMDILII